jgi:hypothetical protein
MNIDPDLFMATYHEHKDRTGHDIYEQEPLSVAGNTCMVCIYLRKADSRRQEQERKQPTT